MSTLKKLLALTLALAMVLSVSVFAGNYSADTYADADKINEDCKDAVEVMYALEIMKGNTDGTFNPEGAIKRSEMAKIIYVIMNGGKDDQAANYVGNSIFTDVPATEWYNGYVNYCAMTKKVQGYDGKFDPNGTLTVAQAAKMLLTAIGYDADAYGFVGANWEANVLTVAHEAGLLTDVATVLTGAAPRQWVAKMVMNSLGAYCYKTIAAIPGNGVLGNYWVNSGNDLNNITTFGEKYMNVSIKTGYLYATNDAAIEGTTFADAVFSFGTVEAKGLGVADLGQEFSVVIKDGKAVSIRNTGKSVVAEALAKDVEYKLTYGTAANNEKNRYEYTVGDLTGKLNTTEDVVDVQVLTVVYNEGNDISAKAVASTTTIKNYVDGVEDRNDVVRAIDKDADGDIDYVITTPVEYAYITKVGTSTKYGDYINATDKTGADLVINGNKNLYIDDLFIGAEDLAKGNFVKFTWNIDEKLFEVEALSGVKGAKFESRKISKNEYTFAGETYGVAANAFESMENVDGASKLTKKFDIVYDGDLLVYVGTFTFALNDMSEINEQLAILVSADINNDGISNVRQAQLFTIDGEFTWVDYDYTGAKKADATNAKVLTWNEIAPDWTTDVDPATWDKLVIVHTNDDGETYVELVADPLNIDGADALVDKVEEIAANTLTVDGGKAKYDSKRIGSDVVFFAMVEDEYCVITMGDLEDAKYVDVTATALVKNNTYYNSIVGGYIKVDSTEATAKKGYLVVTDYAELKADNAYGKVTALVNGAEAEAEIKVTNDIAFFETNGAYAYYTYEVNSDGKYVLSTLTVDDAQTVTPDEELELWFGTAPNFESVDFSDYDYFSLKVTTKLQDENDTSVWETIETTVEFTDAEAIVDFIGECEALEADFDYTYTYNYRYVVDENADLDDLFVMVIDVEMVIN